MQLEAARRLYEMQHAERPYHDGSFESWVKEPSHSHPFHYADGVHIWISKEDLTPDDDFLGQSGAAQESEGDEGEAPDDADDE